MEVVVSQESSFSARGGGLCVRVGSAHIEVDASSDLELLRAVVEVLA